MNAGGTRDVVVGVDGSALSHTALRWAVSYAELTGATVVAITVWDDPVFGEPAALRRAAERVLATAVAELPGTPARIRQEVGHGSAAQVLLDSAKDADLLVVATAGAEDSPVRCSARSASTAPNTLPALW